MDVLDRIRTSIPDFAGYEDEIGRRLADEQIRAYVGERLTAITVMQTLTEDLSELCDRLLLECEFMNQHVFHVFESDPVEARIEQMLAADAELIQRADALIDATGEAVSELLKQIQEAFEQRNSAMQRV